MPAIIVNFPEYMWEQIKEGYVPLGISKYLKAGKSLEGLKSEIDKLDFDFGDFYDHTRSIHGMIDEVWDKYCDKEDI